jgi:hypothetical protein
LYDVSVFVDRNIFMWKCHVPIITDIKLHRTRNVRRKSKSDFPKMSLLTVGYVHFLSIIKLYALRLMSAIWNTSVVVWE